MLLYLYLEQLGLVTINKFCIAAEGRSGFAHPTARPEGEAGLVKPVPASVTAGSASALSACQIQWLRWLRPPLINKFNNKEGSDQIKLNLNKNNKDKGGCNASFYTNNIKNHILNVISLILIVCMIYYFIIGLTIPRLLAVTVSFSISSSALIIFNKTKFSKNKIIKILQKFVLFNFIFIFPIFVSIFLNITFFQDVCWVGSATEAVAPLCSPPADIMAHVAAGIVGAKLGAVAYKEGQGTPALLRGRRQRLIMVGALALSGLIGTVVGIEAGGGAIAILKTLNILENRAAAMPHKSFSTAPRPEAEPAIESNADVNTGSAGLPGLPKIGDNLINCPIEGSEDTIPLVEILDNLISLNILEIVLTVILILILYQKYINKININFITKIVVKYLPNKYIDWFKKYSTSSIKYNDKFTKIMFIYVSILLILLKLGNLYVTAELYNNIDDYVLVYNHIKGIKKGSIFILLSLKSKNLKQNKMKEAAQSTPSPSGADKA